jgi:hypothetical protein
MDARWTIRFAMCSLVLALAGTAQASVPSTMTYQGYLTDLASRPVDGTFAMRFSLYRQAQDGDAFWQEDWAQVTVSKGAFNIALGTHTPLQQGWFGQGGIFVEVSVEGDVIAPRQQLNSVAFAIEAANAQDVRNADINPRSINVGGQQIVSEDGTWVGPSAGLQGPQGPEGPAGAGHNLQCDVGQMIIWRNGGWACEAPPEQPNRGGVCYTAFGINSCGAGFAAVLTGWQANYEAIRNVNSSTNFGSVTGPYCQSLPQGSPEPGVGPNYRPRSRGNTATILDSHGGVIPFPNGPLRCAICCR